MEDQDLAQRYGAPSATRRRLLIGLGVVVALVFGGWLAWTAWFHGTPEVRSELIGYDVIDEHSALADLDVRVEQDTEATCTVRATAEDHTIVGERSFSPTDGRNEVRIRTERRATSVEKVGCTTPEQRRPR